MGFVSYLWGIETVS